jgi:hypothetical protein
MDDQDAGPERSAEDLISRPPQQADLVNQCRELNQHSVQCVVELKYASASALPNAVINHQLSECLFENCGHRERPSRAQQRESSAGV